MQKLESTFDGREVVEWARNSMKTESFITFRKDISKMAQAYISELGQSVNIANKENKRILNSIDLL